MMERESELKDYLVVLLKWKKLIIAITLVSLVAAGIMSYFVLPPIYRGSAVVYLAEIYTTPLLKAKDVQSQIESGSFLQKLSQDLNVPLSQIEGNVSLSTAQDSKVIVVSFDSQSKELIKSFFEHFIVEINNFNDQAYQNQINSLKEKIRSLSSQVESLSKQESDVLEKLKGLEQKSISRPEYTLEYSLLQGVYDSIISKKVTLFSQISDIEAVIKASNVFFYESEPLILDKSVKPRKLFNTAIAGVVALFFSILLAFFLEQIKGRRVKEN